VKRSRPGTVRIAASAVQAADMLDQTIKHYYERAPEESRLEQGPFQLERVRTRELILRHVPEPPAVVLDVGGAAGAYAFWLAERGYEVHLVDATERLVNVARQRNESVVHRLASCEVGDARALPQHDGSADVVLLLGPLYHLLDAGDRHRALVEARRVLRAGGVLIAAGISRWASTLDGLVREVLLDPTFARIVEGDLRDGKHYNPSDTIEYFTTAYFHRPDELRRELIAAELEPLALYGIEGPGWMLPDFETRWNDPARREILLQTARLLESEETILGASAHLLVVGRKR
jgi:ubiquinone/menaquinone biosynthesis C-methylase UbiE